MDGSETSSLKSASAPPTPLPATSGRGDLSGDGAHLVPKSDFSVFALAGDRFRVWLAWLTWAAVALLPLVVEAVQRAGGRTDRAQEEVPVVEAMGKSLVEHGTPYLSRADIAALPIDERLLGYRPYQPGMAIFGLPRALAGDHWWTDARVWFAITAVLAVGLAVAVLRPFTPFPVRAIQAATVLPVTALTLATGGDDIPVLALCLLALALAATGRFAWAGVAVGIAAAAKLFALPVVAVLVVLAVVAGRGRRLIPFAVGLPILALIPPLLVDFDALVENVLRFPLGHGLVTSPAQSPFPGYLVAQHLPGGRLLAAALLGAAALVIGWLLLRRPPRDAGTAALFCGWGLLAAILLMPTTRFGYLLYPAALLVWAPALVLRNRTASSAPRHDTALYRQ
ncbi:glycosyltransferase 87 family protein [Actinoplanes octamycinicus]|uniref:glycosyltransferase 87 family protein n=1 Tax=Actinoplanes octamycinicus TaxID=135948 RepID=UPI00161605EB|nr:glycosyltransferase 87 family protein [Actinoplanes octamycinicus]